MVHYSTERMGCNVKTVQETHANLTDSKTTCTPRYHVDHQECASVQTISYEELSPPDCRCYSFRRWVGKARTP